MVVETASEVWLLLLQFLFKFFKVLRSVTWLQGLMECFVESSMGSIRLVVGSVWLDVGLRVYFVSAVYDLTVILLSWILTDRWCSIGEWVHVHALIGCHNAWFFHFFLARCINSLKRFESFLVIIAVFTELVLDLSEGVSSQFLIGLTALTILSLFWLATLLFKATIHY